MSGETAGRRAEIGQERRRKMGKRLIAAAARVIADRGSANATIDDFISAAGVSRGTFYNHFNTREELLDALWLNVGHDPFLEIRHACEGFSDPAEHLAAMTRMVLQRAAQDPTWGWLVVALSADKKTLNDDLRTFPTPDLTAGEIAGRFRYDELSNAVDLVVGAVRAGLRATLSESRAPSYPQSLCKMILLALGMNRIEAHRISNLPMPEYEDGLLVDRPAQRRAR